MVVLAFGETMILRHLRYRTCRSYRTFIVRVWSTTHDHHAVATRILIRSARLGCSPALGRMVEMSLRLSDDPQRGRGKALTPRECEPYDER